MLLVLSLSLVVGCDSSNTPENDDPATTAAEGVDAVQGANDEAAALELTTDGSENATVALTAEARSVPPSAEAIAAYMAGHVGAALQPPTCHSATTNGATVVYTFDDCTGPRGLTHMTGSVVVTYSVDVLGTHTHSTATNFALNQLTLDIDATTTYTVSAGTRTLTVTTQSSGTGPQGHVVTRLGDYTVTWTDTCHTLDGTWSTTWNGLTGSTTETEVTRCDGACPESGGTVTQTHRNGVTVTITYDGSATAHWSAGSRNGTIQLPCTPGTP
jgi:hypothetical protein